MLQIKLTCKLKLSKQTANAVLKLFIAFKYTLSALLLLGVDQFNYNDHNIKDYIQT